MASKKSVSFEEKLGQLEQIVEDLEQGELSLDESLKAYEAGVKITRDCRQVLDVAEQKIEILSSNKEES